MSNKKFIRDSVHGNLPITQFERELIDYPQIQRLRRLKQLGFISLIYPGANHSRFEHSMGTMHLASQLADQLDLNQEDKELVRVSGLLHDAGHGPFSHVSEAVLDVPHEEITAYVIKHTEIKDKLNEKFNLNDIIDIIHGRGRLGPIISGELDVDRMDYLIRDSHYTGVAYGVIDTERLISNLKLEKELVLDIKGVQAAESLLVARYFMYPSVYQHHTTRIINAMFRRCIKHLINDYGIKPNEMYKYDDSDLVSLCRNGEGYVKETMNRLDNRHLLKTAWSIDVKEFKHPEELFKIKKEEFRKAEEEISEDFNINRENVIINITDYPRFDEMKTQVSLNNKLYHLNEISSIVGALSDARFNFPDISIYVPKEDRSKFEKFKIEHYLDLPEREPHFETVTFDQSKLI
jgi:HD superfamily phosphohydrolase